MSPDLRILHLEDDPGDARLISDTLKEEGLSAIIKVVADRRNFLVELKRGGYDLILADFKLPGFDGLEALALWRTQWPGKPFLFVTGSMGEALAVESLKCGAADYILKGNLSRIVPAIERAVEDAKSHLRRQVAEAASRAKEAELEVIINRTPFMLKRCSRDLRYRFVSPAYAQMIRRRPDEVVGKTMLEIMGEEGFTTIRPYIEQVLDGNEVEYETAVHFQGVGMRYLHVVYTPESDERNTVKGWIASIVDITDRRRAEEALKTSLREKEVLLREVHHRVKNNLQVISSLVSLQADTSSDLILQGMFQDVRNRIRTMALVHEKLYQSDSMALVDFAEYTRSLLDQIWSAHGEAAESIHLNLDLEPVTLPMDQAVPCGLLLNELSSNALKHAFRGRSRGEVTVSLRNRSDGHVVLRVRDNGVDLPAQLDWRRANSLGLTLVQMLTGQLNGTVEARNSGGAEFLVYFAPAENAAAVESNGHFAGPPPEISV